MSTSTASLPGAGHAIIAAAFAEVSRFCRAVFTAPKARPNAAKLSPGTRLWSLYLKTAGLDSVNPALFAERIVQD